MIIVEVFYFQILELTRYYFQGLPCMPVLKNTVPHFKTLKDLFKLLLVKKSLQVKIFLYKLTFTNSIQTNKVNLMNIYMDESMIVMYSYSYRCADQLTHTHTHT